ncbi:capsule biosynthesis protein [Maritimibacter sp. DP1N21-5]|uniref:capsule biosynthesis protein n=1 Tax=Maritimibacter sp. DP1N21-5 TaxID=2836867 RepID=UPI001C4434B5|nr:capsule biosynthesis protein [Maritimibacter sp. DP1N21-5]MBV7409187.1 capsule biosynthesis protein [Maritimibacter sp. DP1N21-5]
MTTPPKARKFRIRRPVTGAATAERLEDDQPANSGGYEAEDEAPRSAPRPAPEPTRPMPQTRGPNPLQAAASEGFEDGFGDQRFPGAAPASRPAQQAPQQTSAPPSTHAATPRPSAPASAEAELAAIKKEGLTGRQLRMARRVAQKHGLPATSDYDAVRLLRRAGVDPFQAANMLQLVSSEEDAAKAGEASARSGNQPIGQIQLPQTVPSGAMMVPAQPKMMDAGERARSIQEMQWSIVRRRRKRLLLLAVRLAAFVLLPTFVAGWYFFNVATPMYATKSEFVIQKADGGTGGSGLGSLFAGSGLGSSQDSITVQSYLTSRDAMLRLDQDIGFKEHFSGPDIDPIQRLSSDASNEETYKTYKRNVKIGYDPTEGIVKMEVIAASPETSAAISEALIRYAEERVDNLTQRLRADQMAGAIESYEDAETEMLAAQQEVLRLQEEMGVYDPTSDAASVMGQINQFELALQQKRLQLQQLLDNPRPNQARVDGVRGDIGRLEALIADMRARLTEEGATGDASIASVSGQLAIATTNLETRTVLMQQALQQLETARIEANKQTRYLEMGVHPVAPDTPTYPREFENTLLAFLVFAGIYLMVSITASILREQVTG